MWASMSAPPPARSAGCFAHPSLRRSRTAPPEPAQLHATSMGACPPRCHPPSAAAHSRPAAAAVYHALPSGLTLPSPTCRPRRRGAAPSHAHRWGGARLRTLPRCIHTNPPHPTRCPWCTPLSNLRALGVAAQRRRGGRGGGGGGVVSALETLQRHRLHRSAARPPHLPPPQKRARTHIHKSTPHQPERARPAAARVSEL